VPDSPWSDAGPFVPNFAGLIERFAVPMQEAKAAASGNWATALDFWIADEFRRAGFPPNEVWPRDGLPTVLPREVAMLLEVAKEPLRSQLQTLIAKTPRVAPRDARVLGRAYVKQVDVVMAQWSRGPELLVSTKTMMSSFRKNLPNRFEEAYGDAANLRGRYPLAAIGFMFVMRASVLAEAGTLQRAIDMLRKLRDLATYDATGLILVDFADDPDETDTPAVLEDEVPADLRASAFFDRIIDRVLEVAPVDFHVGVRSNRLGSPLKIAEADESDAAG